MSVTEIAPGVVVSPAVDFDAAVLANTMEPAPLTLEQKLDAALDRVAKLEAEAAAFAEFMRRIYPSAF